MEMRRTCSCLLLTLASVFGTATESHAQEGDQGPAFLQVCNKGTTTVSAVVAEDDDTSLFPGVYALTVYGWFPIAAGACERVYDQTRGAFFPIPAYVGFAFFDAAGHMTPARVASVPDIGRWNHVSLWAEVRWPAREGPVLTHTAKQLCVHQQPMQYTVDSKSDFDCASFHPDGDANAYQPLVAPLYFHPSAIHCSRAGLGDQYACFGGRYYLDVAPKAGDVDLGASAGDVPADDSEPVTRDPAQDAADVVEEVALLVGVGLAVNKLLAAPAAPPTAHELELQAERERVAAAGPNPAFADANARYAAELEAKWGSPRVSVGDYSAGWARREMHVSGTVAGVSVKDGSPSWLTVRFKEAAGDAFVVCSPSPSIFTGLFGKLDSLVGRKLEVIGYVEQPLCGGAQGGSIRVLDSDAVRVIP
jgi:hypothetical protein